MDKKPTEFQENWTPWKLIPVDIKMTKKLKIQTTFALFKCVDLANGLKKSPRENYAWLILM